MKAKIIFFHRRILFSILFFIVAAPANALSPGDLEFSVRASCSTYSGLSGTSYSWFKTWGDESASMELLFADDYGNPLKSLALIKGSGFDGLNFAYRFSENSGIYHSDSERYQAFNALMRENLDKNLLIRCRHVNSLDGSSQTFHLFAPLKLRDAWKGTHVLYSAQQGFNLLGFEIDHLTDLYYRVTKVVMNYLPNQQSTLSSLDSAFSSLFPETVHREFDLGSILPQTRYSEWDVGYNRLQLLRNAGSSQNAVNMLLRGLAMDYTSGSVELLNTVIAEEVERALFKGGNGRCKLPWVCAAFLNYQELLKNPRFADGMEGWTVKRHLIGGALGYPDPQLLKNRDQRIRLNLEANHAKDAEPSLVALEQTIPVSSASLDKLHLFFRTGAITGGSNVFGGFSYYSGIAGIYFCAKNDGRQLGCWFASKYTDNVKLPILVGQYYDPKSSSNFKYAPISNTRHSQMINIGKIIRQNLPDVDITDVNQITVGAIATESFGELGKICIKCFASIELDELSLRLVE